MRWQTQAFVQLLVCAAALLVTLYLYAFGASRADFWPAALLTAISGTGYALLRTGHGRYAAHLLIAGVVAVATLAAILFGSVRSAGATLFVGAVVGAGIFTGRLASTLTTLTSVLLIAGLFWAERIGLIVPRQLAVGVPALVIYVAATLVVSVMVYYSRHHSEVVMQRLQAELESRQRTERERDRSQDRFRRIFHGNPSPMLAQSARNGMILDVNPAFERCYGYTSEQLLGRPDDLLWADPAQRLAYVELLLEHRRTDKDRVITLWIDPSLPPAPVRVLQREDGEDAYELRLVSIE